MERETRYHLMKHFQSSDPPKEWKFWDREYRENPEYRGDRGYSNVGSVETLKEATKWAKKNYYEGDQSPPFVIKGEEIEFDFTTVETKAVREVEETVIEVEVKVKD